MKKKYIFLCLWALFSCSKENLSSNSVVEDNIVQRQHTELDTYISENFIKPYGISVEYRWNNNTAPKGNYTYPPQPEKVKQVLQAIQYLWLETYTLSNIGGSDFMKGKNPIKIYMYGGKNLDANGLELISNPNSGAIEMHLYNINEFDPKSTEQVYILMRSVHHQFAKRLLELFPYDRDKFVVISQKKYLSSTQDIKQLSGLTRLELFGIESYANKRGFFTQHSRLSAEDDFAEIISVMLTNSQKEVEQGITTAQTPDTDIDPQVQQRYNEEAKEAYAEITQKQTMVSDYFKKEIKINLTRMQTISVQRIKAYINQ
ncbi:MAG: putative zinc-binding metallopeptidase [Capnocytophaga sp.]|nr:putative zinc-binding metallopeptidase [Capnocytophaga sp.]